LKGKVSVNEKRPAKVSVILVTRDRSDELRGALESLSAQSWRDFEVVVVNDGGSPVESVLEGFSDLECRLITLPHTRGAAAGRNRGAREARGEWLAFLDDTGRFGADHLEALLALRDRGEVVRYADAHEVLLTDAGREASRSVRYSQEFDADRLLLHPYIPLVASLVRKDAFERVGGFDEQLRRGEDWDLWIRLADQGPFVHLAAPTAEVRLRPDEPAPLSGPDGLEVRRRLAQKHADGLADKPYLRTLQRSQWRRLENELAGRRFDLGVVLVARHDGAEVRRALESLAALLPPDLACQALVADDASRSDTTGPLVDLPMDPLVFRSDEPMGLSQALTQAVELVSAPWCLVLEPTTRLTSAALEALLAAVAAHPGLAAVGPGWDDLMDRTAERPTLDVACMLVRTEPFRKLGGFDPSYQAGYWDDDLAMRLTVAGWSTRSLALAVEADRAIARRRRQDPMDRSRFAHKWGDWMGDLPAAVDPTSDPPRYSLVALTYNQLDYTRLFVESVLAHSTEPYELILVDNASVDGTPDYLRDLAARHPQVRIVLNQENKGFAGGCNQGVALARGEFVVFVNNDTVVTHRWLERFSWIFASDPAIGIIGPLSNHVAGLQLVRPVPYDEEDQDAIQEFAAIVHANRRREGCYAVRVIGFCMPVRRSVLEQIGGFDLRFGIGNMEDDDLCMRARKQGYKVWIANDVFIQHYGSKSFKAVRLDYKALIARNLAIFCDKWQVPQERRGDSSYNYEWIMAQPLDPEQQVVPILTPEVPPIPIDGAHGLVILAIPDWERDRDALARLFKAYAEAFRPADDVSLVLWHDPTRGPEVEAIGALLEEILEHEGIPAETLPDVILHAEPLGPLRLGGLYRAAHALCVLGKSPRTAEAEACGIPCLVAPTAAELRGLLAAVP